MTISYHYSDIKTPLLIESSLSTIACLWLLLTITKCQNKAITINMIKWIGILDLFQALFIIASLAIKAEAASINILFSIISSFNLSSMFLSICLSVYSYNVIISKKKWDCWMFNVYSRLCSIILGFIIGVLPLIYYIIAQKGYSQDLLLRQILYGIVIFGTISCSIYCYTSQILYIKRNFNLNCLKELDIQIGKVALYPILLILVYTPIQVVQLFEVVPKTFYYASHLCYSSSGIVNTIIFFKFRNYSPRVNTIQEQAKQSQTTTPSSIEIDGSSKSERGSKESSNSQAKESQSQDSILNSHSVSNERGTQAILMANAYDPVERYDCIDAKV